MGKNKRVICGSQDDELDEKSDDIKKQTNTFENKDAVKTKRVDEEEEKKLTPEEVRRSSPS